MNIDSTDIERAIISLRGSHPNTVMPRFTPFDWWECDVCEVTAAGFFREYEIKMSRSDFLVDAQKHRFLPWDAPNPGAKEMKHDLLAAGDARGPSRFSFVTPAGLLKPEDIPQWAGLIEVSIPEYSMWPTAAVVIKAPKLHGQKAPDSLRRSMTGSAYTRLHTIWSDNYYRHLCERRQIEPVSVS
mgnify:CR=1 FL=1